MTRSIAEAWQRQIDYCDAHGSPFTARVLEAAMSDWQAGGTLRDLLPDWPGDAWVDALPLRVAGALHSLALDGSDAALAALYPPRRRAFDASAGPPAVAAAMQAHRARIADYLRLAPQTNEIGRSAVLLGGFAAIAEATRLPLATLEIGASAGLNRWWRRYRYALGHARTWGDAHSPVLVRSDWLGPAPALPERFELASVAACDIAPLELNDPAEALRVVSYVWPDQRERIERLQAAIALARRLQPQDGRVEQADADDWVARELAEPRSGRAMVLYHSVMWQYLPKPTRATVRDVIAAAGARASADAPFAWLAFEPDAAGVFELALTLWPGGQRRLLAHAHAHGHHAHWFRKHTAVS